MITMEPSFLHEIDDQVTDDDDSIDEIYNSRKTFTVTVNQINDIPIATITAPDSPIGFIKEMMIKLLYWD